VEILLAIAGVTSLVWVAVVFWRGGLFAGCLAVVFAGYVVGHAFFNAWVVTVDRVLWAVLIVQFAVCCWHGSLERKPWGKTEFFLVAWFAWLAISVLTHDWQIDNSAPLKQLLVFFALPLGLYFVARRTPLNEKKAKILLGAFLLLGLYLAITALAETRQWWWLVYPKHIASMENMEYFGRGRGPLLNASANGILLATCLFAGLMFWPRVGPIGKVLVAGYVPLISVGLFCTYTRSVWLGAAVGVAVIMWFVLPRRVRIPLFASGLVAATVLVAVYGQRFVAFKRDVQATAADTAESVRLRPILAMVAWKMVQDQPLTGCGFGQYTHVCVHHLGDRDTKFVLEKARPFIQHNIILRLASETGLPGAVMFVIIVALWAVDCVRILRNRDGPPWVRQVALVFLATLAAYLANGMFHDVTQINMMNAHLMLWAGFTAGLRLSAQQKPVEPAVPLPTAEVPWHPSAPPVPAR
jgi:O-antigen ligase